MKKLLLSMLIAISVTAVSQIEITPDKVQMGSMTIIIEEPQTLVTYVPLMTEYEYVVKKDTLPGFKTNLDYYYLFVICEEEYEWRFLGLLTNEYYKGSQVFDQDGTLVYIKVSGKKVSIKPVQ